MFIKGIRAWTYLSYCSKRHFWLQAVSSVAVSLFRPNDQYVPVKLPHFLKMPTRSTAFLYTAFLAVKGCVFHPLYNPRYLRFIHPPSIQSLCSPWSWLAGRHLHIAPCRSASKLVFYISFVIGLFAQLTHTFQIYNYYL